VPLDDAIRAAAERCGVQQKFWDIFGKPHVTETDTNRAILSSFGFDTADEATLAASVDRRDAAEWRCLLPPVLVVSGSGPVRIPIRAPQNVDSLELAIELETGERQNVLADFGKLEPGASAEIDGVTFVERVFELPSGLPLGYHKVKAGDCSLRLIVTPDSARKPERGRHAGLGVTLWGLRSESNWGCGDFRDLVDLIDWAVPKLHADFIALNPLHALHNRAPYNTSPYLPLTIFYRNFIYLDIEAIVGFEGVREAFYTDEALEQIEANRDAETVQYEAVAKVKRRALDLIFEANPPGEDCLRWIEAEGSLLRQFAIYCALDEHLHAQNPDLWVWTDWPEEYRDPGSQAVRDFAETHAKAILFHGWVQWLIDEQIEAVQRHALAAGMTIGLYHDLALATDRCGADLWAYRPFFMAGSRVGAPPDGFSPTGQDWSFPPPNEERHRADGYRLYTESIRKTMRHGGALRIDHVMRLFRLYWIPEGHDAAHGAYVEDRPQDLVRILALESVRNNAVIIGEDLGTVEDDVRETLAKFGILSYRLLIFEHTDSSFKMPEDYPAQALTSTTTHDLPTMAGFFTGQDIEARLATGTVDRANYEQQWRERIRDKQNLLNALFAKDLLPAWHERDAAKISVVTPELHYAIAGFLAGTPCALWLINQEDISRERFQQNMPGTTAEYPNWSRKMLWTIEELGTVAEAVGCTEMFRIWVERSGRS
jgi:4-alpha-glucanotransferase